MRKFLLLIFLQLALLSVHSFGQTVNIRNTDAQAVTSTVLKNGSTIYRTALPPHWTAEFNFNLPPGRTVKAVFQVDNGATAEYDQPPYCPTGHNTPLNLIAGPHTIAIVVNGVAMPSITFNLLNAPPATNAVPATQIASTQPTYYVSLLGNDSSNGKTLATAFRTPRVIDGSTVVLASGQKFIMSVPLDFSGHSHTTITTDSVKPAFLVGPNAAAGSIIGPNITKWWTTSSDCTLANVIIDSADGKGFGGNVRGSGVKIVNVTLNNLAEGFDYIGPCTDLTITGGGQSGKVSGRCHYFLDVTNLTWTGDPSKVFGYASTQSPIRFSSPGVRGGTITGVRVTQVGSPFPIACWAIHHAENVTWNDCISDTGEFSFDSAGAGLGDVVSGCNINRLHTINTKINLSPISFKNRFTDCTSTNPTGECIAVGCAAVSGNIFDGCNLSSPLHAIHFYTACDAVVKNCNYNRMGSASGKLIDGSSVPANDGGGNVTK